MPTLKTSDGIQLIESFMKAAGGKPAEWYVGLSSNGRESLAQHGMQGNPFAESWEFDNEDAAAASERYFLEGGLRPTARQPDAGEPRTHLYVYRAPRITSFREFLERTEKQQDPENKRTAQRQEWIDAVERLVSRLMGWVREVDSTGLLALAPFRLRQTEMGLGTYEVPGFTIRLKDVIIQVRPVSRNVVGTVKVSPEKELKAEGRVDLTEGSRRYTLYRTLEGKEERWYIVDEESNTAELDQNQFMAVLEDLFS